MTRGQNGLSFGGKAYPRQTCSLKIVQREMILKLPQWTVGYGHERRGLDYANYVSSSHFSKAFKDYFSMLPIHTR
ncbi:hypothetical protein, partial [Mesorhizobium sp. M4A.F.Ca.ET.050.02.1.1]|uniref:hypothetical protein n=1 Tax=Mesorhizobium sp. M4A.F.Ca.ET.050.02.1.1 TaxID=2496754 RepID=UPI001AEC9B76